MTSGRHRRPRPGRYLPGAEGAAAYAAAAQRNTTARGDPHRTLAGPPDPRRLARDLAALCCCGDTKGCHDLDDATGERTACRIATADGPCGCRRFTPRRTVTEGEGTPDDLHQRP